MMRRINTSEELVAAMVDLFGAALDYTHSNQGEKLHAEAYRVIDDVAHSVAFYIGSRDDLAALLASLPKETYWKPIEGKHWK